MVQFNRSVMGGNFFRLIFKSDSLTDGTGLGMGKFMGIGQEHKIKGRRIGGETTAEVGATVDHSFALSQLTTRATTSHY